MTCVSVVLIPVSRGLMRSELVSNSPVISLVDVGEQKLELSSYSCTWESLPFHGGTIRQKSQALAMPLEQVTPSLCLGSLLR